MDPPGDDWQAALIDGVKHSAVVLVLLSADTCGSHVQRAEILLATELARHQPDRHRVVPIYLDDCDDAATLAVLGLQTVQAIQLSRVGDLAGVARRLLGDPRVPPDEGLGSLVERLETLLLERARHAADQIGTADREKEIDDLSGRIRARALYGAGDRVAGTVLEKIVGSGNFGTIWLARDQQTDKLVATKVFDLNKLTLGVMLWRFRRSVRAITELNKHRNCPAEVVRLHRAHDGDIAFSMDYLSGGSLENVERRGWTLERKIEIFLQVCRATVFAHEKGIIHRDIKPANIVFDDSNRPVLTDFDISDINFVTRLSVASGGLGTPVFAAPEQQNNADDATEQSDIYSLGRLLHYLLLERSPGLVIEPDPSLADLGDKPSALVAVVRRATQLRPQARYPDVRAMIHDLENYQTGMAALRARLKQMRRWVRRNWPFCLVALLMVAIVAVYAEMQRRNAEQAAASQARFQDLNRRMLEVQKEVQQERTRALDLDQAIRTTELECEELRKRRDAVSRESQAWTRLHEQLEENQRRLAALNQERDERRGRLEKLERELEKLGRESEAESKRAGNGPSSGAVGRDPPDPAIPPVDIVLPDPTHGTDTSSSSATTPKDAETPAGSAPAAGIEAADPRSRLLARLSALGQDAGGKRVGEVRAVFETVDDEFDARTVADAVESPVFSIHPPRAASSSPRPCSGRSIVPRPGAGGSRIATSRSAMNWLGGYGSDSASRIRAWCQTRTGSRSQAGRSRWAAARTIVTPGVTNDRPTRLRYRPSECSFAR